ncbi:ferrichrome-iron receptor precursor [mine drainage metagenome]|uniref:Ferrichrome-iron receptor n=1 Tax=mine drainage metagenome TaxID=410659 RepID=A0A1J5RPT0_9ZZZZ
MNKHPVDKSMLAFLAALAFVAVPSVQAQQASQDQTTTSDTKTKVEDETIELSPFTVSADEDKGSYTATATLAGSRIRTDIKDVASSISVITPEFLRDTGARNNQDLLIYTTNTEVGGIYGNYAGVGSTFINGASESSNFLKPSQNTRVRGLDSADNTRDYFQTDIPWDAYNVGRIDLQRGPNSILFGIGSPAGIINSSINEATFKKGGNVENRFDRYGSQRFSLDYNYVLIPQELAFRVSALDDNTKFRQRPAYNHDRRIFGALRYDPKLFDNLGGHTSFKANFEAGDVQANRPRDLPPEDRITPYFDPNAFNRQSYDPYYAWQSGEIGYPSTNTPPTWDTTWKKNYWLVQYPGPGVQATVNPIFTYDAQNSSTPASVREASPNTIYGLGVNSSGQVISDASIDGFPFGSNIGIGSFNEYTYNTWRNNVMASNGNYLYPAADKGFWKGKSLTDTSIFNYFDNLIDGPNKKEWQKWKAFDLGLSQTFLDNRVGFEAKYDYQDYNDGQERNLNNPYISVDIRSHLMVYPWTPQATSLAVVNPNVGRAFVGSSAKNGGNSTDFTTRENERLTAFAEFRATDVLHKGLLTDIIGRHVVTGLWSRETYTAETRNFVRYALDSSWSNAIGTGTANGGNGSGGLTNGDVVLDWMTYLTGNLSNRTSAAGLDIGRISVVQSPTGAYSIPYFDSHWGKPTNPSDPNYVDPKAAWTNVYRPDGTAANTNGAPSTQTENPLNYVGWVNGTFNVLNADNGDINRLYTDVSHIKKQTTSKGLTLQSYLWKDTIVATYGWRDDRQTLASGSSTASTSPSGVASINPPLGPIAPDAISDGQSVSYGVVVHTPKPLRKFLPQGMDVSLTYSHGRNTRVETRYGFDGAALPNSQGVTKDMGVVVSAFDGRLQFKATYYKTDVKDANLASVTTEVSTLGSNTYYIKNLEAWGTASAMLDLAGRAGGAAGWEWYWNWALVDNGWNSIYNDPTGSAFKNNASTQAQTTAINSWLAQMNPQSWYDAYGFPVNVAAAKAGDWQHAISGWTPFSGVGGLQPSGGGRINGAWPTGTADNESKGWEFEVVGSPVKGLNVSLNASKTFASQTALGANLVNFLNQMYTKYSSPAGDLRLWWGGDATLRQYFMQNIWSAYQFQLQTNGKMVPEMAPWRFNLITNYTFPDSGRLKGFNVGIGYRWEEKHILGYALNATMDNLDVDKPYWSPSYDYVDAWMGYQRKISHDLTWRIQLNMRNIGRGPQLVPISVQPDGSPAGFRIQEGMTWTVTNTFSF